MLWGSFTRRGGGSGLAREQSSLDGWWEVGGPSRTSLPSAGEGGVALQEGRSGSQERSGGGFVPCRGEWGSLGTQQTPFLQRTRTCSGSWSSQPCPRGRWSSQAGGVASASLASLPRPWSGPFSAIPQLVLGRGEGGAGGLFSWWGRCEHRGPTCVVHRALTAWAPVGWGLASWVWGLLGPPSSSPFRAFPWRSSGLEEGSWPPLTVAVCWPLGPRADP